MADPGRRARCIRVEVAYALPDRQALLELEIEEGATVTEAIERSGIRARFPGITLDGGVGVFGRQVALDAALRDGDRVEIYRPLLAEPKETRRERARQAETRRQHARQVPPRGRGR